MKEIQAPEQFIDPAFPVNGIDLSNPFGLQRAGTTIRGENVRAFEASTLRGRGGSRPGLSRFINSALPAEIQNLNFVVTAKGTALLANYNDTPPDLYDPSSFGPPDAWPPGRFTRSPALGIPDGGWGIPPYKDLPETVSLTWATPADIASGTALSGTQLNAVAYDRHDSSVVNGTYSYLPDSGVVLPIGQKQPLAVTFVPTNTSKYATTVGANLINVVTGAAHTIEYIQSATGSTVSAPALVSIDVSFASDVAQDAFIVVAVGWHALTSAAGVAIVDTQGNTYTQLAGDVRFNTNVDELSLWYTIASSGPLTVQIAGTDAGWMTACILEYHNVESVSNPIDAVASTSSEAATTSYTTGTVLVSGSNEMVLGAFLEKALDTVGDAMTGTGGFTVRVQTPNYSDLAYPALAVADLIGLSSDTAATVSSVTSTGYGAIGVSVKPG